MSKIFMKHFIMLLILSLTAILFAQSGKPEIKIVYPNEGAIIQAAPSDSCFIFGQITPANSKLEINNKNISIYQDGSFLAYLPVNEDDFVFDCVVYRQNDSLKFERNIFVQPLIRTNLADSMVIEDALMHPTGDVRLHQGDLFRMRFKGTPGCTASFSIDGVREDIPMAEVEDPKLIYWGEHVFGDKPAYWGKEINGIYEGSYLIQPLDWRENRSIVFQLVNSQGDTIKKISPHKLAIFDNSFPQMAKVKSPKATLRTGVGAGYYYFLPKGTKLQIDGQYGNYLRVKLSETENAWVQKWDVKLLPKGSVPPNKIVNVLRVKDVGSHVRVKMIIGERIPFKVEQTTNPQQILINFWGITSDTDWIKYEAAQDLIKDIRWKQTAQESYQLSFQVTQKQQWGYDVYYDEENNFYIDVKKAPKVAGWPSSPLKNINILLDPGHLPDTGAVSPTGITEADVNYKLAVVLEKKLRSKGANVYLTRRGEHGITLRARMNLAEMFGADILLSLHHNALPDGINPFRNRGSSTYYYHPQSFLLAEAIHGKILKRLELNNFGLYYDNLAMCRPTQMPSVLIEPAFLMHPEEAMMINSDEYRNKCSNAIVEGLEGFVRNSK
jgi:N-acetylmuramoyl-L-alanine amidase